MQIREIDMIKIDSNIISDSGFVLKKRDELMLFDLINIALKSDLLKLEKKLLDYTVKIKNILENMIIQKKQHTV